MSVSISPQMYFTAQETIELGVAAATDPAITHDGFNYSATLNADSTPPVTKASYQEHTLDGSGDLTLDLTDLPGVSEVSQNCTGLKVQTLIINNPADNAALTISPGASNPYPLFGTGNDLVVPPGATMAFSFVDQLADVSGTVKTIDFAGGNAESFELGICLG